MKGSIECVKLVTERKDIDVIAQHLTGSTALHDAIYHGRSERRKITLISF